MIWRLSSLPELNHLTQAQRATLIRSSIGKRFEFNLWLTSGVRGLASSFILCYAVISLLNALARNNLPGSYLAVVVFLTWPIFAVVMFQFSINRIRGQIRMYLQDQRTLGVKPPVCLKCGYAVEDASDQCPECGAAV